MSQASSDAPMCATAWQRLPAPPPNPEVFEIMEFCAWAAFSNDGIPRDRERPAKSSQGGRKSLITIDNARAWLNSLPTMRSA
jgi:hypothetical protein